MENQYLDQLIKEKRYLFAENKINKLIKKNVVTFDLYVRAIHVSKALMKKKETIELYRKAIKLFPHKLSLIDDFVIFCLETEEYDESIYFLLEILQKIPNDLGANIKLARSFLGKKDFKRAKDVLDNLIQKNIADSAAYVLFGDVYFEEKDSNNAYIFYSRALTYFPHTSHSVSKFFRYCILTNRLDEIEKILSTLSPQIKNEQRVMIFLATYYLHINDLKEAQKYFESIFSQNISVTPREYTQSIYEHGFLLDQMGQYENATKAFVAANDFASRIYGQITGPTVIELVSTLKKLNITGMEGDNCPIFVLGFMRSGTTMVDQILSTNGKVQVFEEVPVIETILLEHLEKIQNNEEISRADLQRRYFDLFKQKYAWDEGKIIIDRSAPNIIFLNLIREIFPSSKIILVHRHPLDIVLSCFMQFFSPNIMTCNFMNLKHTVDVFEYVMKYVLSICDQENIYQVKYEDLVSNFDGTTQKMFQFLDLEWSPKTAEFYKIAKEKKLIKTASYHQVVQPLYKHSVYRWQNYKTLLEPLSGRLKDIIESLGYPYGFNE